MPSRTKWLDDASSTKTSSSTSSSSSSPLHNLLPDEPIPEYKHVTSLPWILHHILECELASELPLRIMFSFNAGHRLPTLKEANKWWRHEPRGKLIIEFLEGLNKITPPVETASTDKLQGSIFGAADATASTQHDSQDRFMDAGNDALFDLSFLAQSPTADRRQSQGMPKDFIRNFCLNHVFNPDYNEVDYNQALTAIDYLRDLECTRRTALREAAGRLGIEKDNWREILAKDPVAKKWVEDVQGFELAIEEHYARIFVDLRIWTMINELQIEPFYKPNVLAMLNTIFPPSVRELPNDRIGSKTLYKYRSLFYKYISAVEENGHSVLDSFIVRLGQPGSKHSWPITHQNLVKYLDLADTMIDQASAVTGVDFFRNSSSMSLHSRNASTTSSSFSGRPLTGSSANSSLDGAAPLSSTPRTPNFPADGSVARSKFLNNRKLSAPSDAQDAFEPESRTSSGSSEGSEASTSTIRNTREKNDTTPTPRAMLERLDSNQSSKSGTSLYRTPGLPSPAFLDEYRTLRATISNSPSVASPAISSSRRRSTSTGRPSAHDFRSPLAPTPEARSDSPIPPTPVLPRGKLDFLSRPYEANDIGPAPSLKKQRSFGSLFQRKKSSLATVYGVDSEKENIFARKGQGLGISIGATKSNDKLPWPKLSPSKSTTEFPRYSNDASGFEYPSLRNNTTDNSPSLSIFRDDKSSKAARRKGLSIFTTASNTPQAQRPSMSEATFIETGNEYERYIVQYPSSPLPTDTTSLLRKQRSTPNLAGQSQAKLRKASSSSRLRTSSTYHPAPQETTTTSPTHRRQKLYESSDDFQNREHSRAWLLEASRAEKLGLQRPKGRRFTDHKDEVDGLFRPQEFENPRAVPMPAVRRDTAESLVRARQMGAVSPSSSVLTGSFRGTPILGMAAEERGLRKRNGSHTPILEVSKFAWGAAGGRL